MKVYRLAALVLALLSHGALAWDSLGHMIVAAVAYDQLTLSVRARANELIKLNPDYNELVADAKKANGVDKNNASESHADPYSFPETRSQHPRY